MKYYYKKFDNCYCWTAFALVLFFLILWIFIPDRNIVLLNADNAIKENEVVWEAGKVEIRGELLPMPFGVRAAHSVTLVALPDSRLAAAWFAGEKEGSPDTSIYMSIRDSNKVWETPWVISSVADISNSLMRHVQCVGNPLLYVDESGKLNLYFVATDWGGWSMSKVNFRQSADNGHTWSKVKRLGIGAMLNLSYLVRNNPLRLKNGRVLLPTYYECATKYPSLLEIDDSGTVLNKWSFPQIIGGLQPAIVEAPNGNIYMYCRDGYGTDRRIHFAEIAPDGELIDSRLLNIANPNAAVAVTDIGSAYVMVCNPVEKGRSMLSLYISKDGRNFKKVVDLENWDVGEYSYPSMVWDGEVLHIAYTWKIQTIKHVEVRGLINDK